MSEQLNPTYDVIKTAEMYADPSLNEQLNADDRRLQEWLGPAGNIDVDTAKDVANYLTSRPVSENPDGSFTRSITGKEISREEADSLYGKRHVEHDDYENMSPIQLARLSAEAEARGDRTTMLSVDDALENSIVKLGLDTNTTQFTDKAGNIIEHQSAQDTMLDRVMKIREEHYAKITGQQEAHEANMEESLPAPDSEGIVIDSYVNAEGVPLMEGDALKSEIEKIVANGDIERFGQAANALWTAARAEAKRRGDSKIMNNVKAFLDEASVRVGKSGQVESAKQQTEPIIPGEVLIGKPADSKSNSNESVDSASQEESNHESVVPSRRSFKDRVKSLLVPVGGYGGYISQKFGNGAYRIKEWASARFGKENENYKRNRILTAVGLGVAAVGGAYVAYKLGTDVDGKLADNFQINPNKTSDSDPNAIPVHNGPNVTLVDSYDIAPTVPSTVAIPSESLPTQENLDAVTEAVNNRSNEILNTPGAFPWSKAEAIYGEQATSRLVQAADTLKERGMDVQWSSDPWTNNKAYLSINGNSDTSYVWEQVHKVLAEQDLANLFESTENQLPKTA